jgi:hypothetical protein
MHPSCSTSNPILQINLSKQKETKMTQPKIATKYRISGASVLPFQQQEGSIVDRVPPAYYKVESHPFMGFYLEKVADNVEIPTQIYGSTLPRVQRIFESYKETDGCLGVGLFGKKGAGKSLLASVVANRAITEGIPVVDVSESFSTSPAYLEFLNSIDECVIIFDEFLKHLSKLSNDPAETDSHDRRSQLSGTAKERQDEMLTFFQGTHNKKRLIMLIDNQTHMLSEFLTDRPGRMRYMYNYEGVEREVVEALAENNGISGDKVSQLVMYSLKYRVSFDVINEIIKEWSRYPEETLEELTGILNVPTLMPDTITKVKVLSFAPAKEGVFSKATLVNDLGTLDSRGTVTIEVSRPNDMYGVPMMTEEEHDNSDYDHMLYSRFLELREQPLITQEFRASVDYLVAIKGNQQMYENDGVVFVVETLDTVVTNRSTAWGAL